MVGAGRWMEEAVTGSCGAGTARQLGQQNAQFGWSRPEPLETFWGQPCSGAQIRPWGFELADIAVPVLVMHGRQDKFVPFAHGQWLATHIPEPKPGCSMTTGT
jgi:pimeloyl-ACP methyl ester carboxylesterase